ncbi:MAG: Anthranilate phosphoribosyltransferase [uncultured Corynebacteriales bacterium]|uniref:Anthranilate phosphoribosyltransferase n=1 Tax=uncultured Mycobacteriales bacterium TaxID=581187 RepID=A0A6J4IVH8_9ACTN|nr:MAG: Anthranilate phosphoribosyltransferase [uncultured Corynebacteriales bacterium]
MPTWPDVLGRLIRGESLATADTSWAMGEIMAGEATPVQLAAFAVLLRAKGETPAELGGLVTAMLAAATPVQLPGPALDVVGTGGDRANTVNISTMSALVAAGAGARVVKHGNRAASSACGSADLVEALGVTLSLPGPAVARCVEEAGIGFCFAPVYHPGMRHAGVPRREMGVPTPFNFLGPLTNPARPTALAVGCADERMAPVMAAVLADRGDTALVFRGDDGLDELTTTTTSRVWVVRGGAVTEERFDPGALGVPVVDREALRGGDATYNAKVARALLAGDRGPVRDAVLLNAGAALAAYDGLGGPLADAVGAGMARAAAAIDSGAAADVLDRWVTVSASAG